MWVGDWLRFTHAWILDEIFRPGPRALYLHAAKELAKTMIFPSCLFFSLVWSLLGMKFYAGCLMSDDSFFFFF